ncbi:NUDIX hydrolase [Zongyangia hominis]|uniref:NUDIX hydrolase n=1 Tax=Zongyangia hominis TaxID=2763677 RepID=A0A926EC35_9FIRM|nr:NUDIX hydrolase [Zongyangia hominis]MBC8571162.1 NUDIX hydrolase [Zongyangia hominis]
MKHIDLLEAFRPGCEQEERDLELILSLAHADPLGILTRRSLTAHLTPSGLIFNPDGSRVLLVRHNLYGAWCWTGGHADGDPDLGAVAVREAEEETGVPVKLLSPAIAALDILPVYGHRKNGTYVSAHLHLCPSFVLIAKEEVPPRALPSENSGAQWFNLADIREASGEAWMYPIYEKLIARAKRYR